MKEIIEQLQYCSLDELIVIRHELSKLMAARIKQARIIHGLWPDKEIKKAIECAQEDWNETAYAKSEE